VIVASMCPSVVSVSELGLARSVYKNNDRRAEIKRQVNEQLGSKLLEEKSYSKSAAADVASEIKA
jgi:hypothetical protein